MRGFKSFAKRTELVFGKDFNCILGPNGSGKSNVLDALCFVLGRGSAKSLRAEKSANLIYNGGKNKKQAKDGEVSITFDNKDSIFPVEEDVVKITRVIRQTGQSIYRINDKTSTRQQILELLSHAKIDPDGFNIILQGDIIRFVEMSANERRQVMEEVSGIGVYEEKKGKALRELDKVETRLNEADIILTERSTYLKELKKERDQAIKFKELKDRLHTNKATMLDIKITRKNVDKAKHDKEIGEAKEKFDKAESEIRELKSKIEELTRESNRITREIEEKGEKNQVDIHKQVEKLKVDIATNKTRVESLKNEVGRVKQRKLELKAELNAFSERSEDLVKEQARLQKLKQVRNKELEQVEDHIERFRKKNKIDNAVEVDNEIDELDGHIEIQQKVINELREKQQELFRSKDQYEYQIQTLDERIAKVLNISKEHQVEIKNLKNKKDMFKKATLDLNKRLTEDSSFAAKVGDARKRLIIAEEKLSKLNARNVSNKANMANDLAMKRILDLKQKMNGIYGTVSELGKVSKKFGLALEIAAGNKIRQIVVQDDRVAAECIRYLKKNQLGVATFIPLNKIRPAIQRPEVQKLKHSPGVQGMAMDLITFDNKFKNVFSYVFGNILVVDSIDVTRKIGIGSAKMVTLDGDLADISGAMKGGYRSKQRSLGFVQEEVTRDLEETEGEIADLQSVVSTYSSRRQDNEEEIVRLRKEKAELEGEIIKTEKSLHLEGGDLDASKLRKDELRAKLKEADKESDEVQSKVSVINRDLAQLKMKKQALKTKINQLRNPRLVAELNAFDEKKVKLKEDVIHIEADLRNLRNQLEVSSPEREKINNIIRQHDKEVEKFGEETDRLNSIIKQDAEQLKEKEKLSQEFYAKYKKLFSERSKLQEDANKHNLKVDRTRDESRKVEIKMNMASLENAKVKAELAGLEHEYKQYEGVPLDKTKSEGQLKAEIDKFERLAGDMGAVNMKALEIYDKVELEYNGLIEKKETLVGEKADVLVLIDEIEIKKTDMFMKTFEIINENFKRIFKTISTKGEAFLKLENPEKPFDGGVRVLVRLSGTKFMDIRSLSGGEKTMTALAFIFGIQEHEPHSFYVLDEVDAALDKHNAETLARLIRAYVGHAQYIVISHNDAMISEADNLYGVAMNEHGMTNVTSLKL